jgi:hypothetical protein
MAPLPVGRPTTAGRADLSCGIGCLQPTLNRDSNQKTREGVMDCSFFSESTGLYFYSAVFQGNMALLALVGVFAVFRIQQLTNRKNGLMESIVRYVSDSWKAYENAYPLAFETVADLKAALNELITRAPAQDIGKIGAAKKLQSDLHLIQIMDRYDTYEIDINRTSKKMLTAFGLTVATIALSLILLIFVRPLTLLSEYILLISMIATAFLSLCALLANVRFVFSALDADIPRWAGMLCCYKKETARGGESPDSPRV